MAPRSGSIFLNLSKKGVFVRFFSKKGQKEKKRRDIFPGSRITAPPAPDAKRL
jgi:hypothetical protein